MEKLYDMPIFVSKELPPDDNTSRLYLLDLDKIEIPICDCINHDRNGNPNCSLHKGKLQEFYDPDDVLYLPNRKGTNHVDVGGKALCNPKQTANAEWFSRKAYINCKACLRSELVQRNKLIEAHRLVNPKGQFYYKMFEAEGLLSSGKIEGLR